MAVNTIESRSPQAQDDVVAEVPAADEAAVAAAFEQARAAAREWAGGHATVRAVAILRANAII